MDIPYKWDDTICGLCDWLHSHTIVFFRVIHIVEYINSLFFFLAKQLPSVWIDYILLNNLSVEGHLSYFSLLAVISNAAVIIGIHEVSGIIFTELNLSF